MSNPLKIAIVVGSLRKGAFSHSLAKALSGLGEARLLLKIVEIGDLALYNPDIDGQETVGSWNRFRAEIKATDAVLFITPEYNRSVPGALKNAIDVGSRPYGQSAWAGKPAGIISLSPGAIGAFAANHHLRQSLVFLDMPVLQQPEAYIGNASSLFDSTGGIAKADTAAFLKAFLSKFTDWIEKTASTSF